MRRTTLILLAIAVAALMLAACGDDGGDPAVGEDAFDGVAGADGADAPAGGADRASVASVAPAAAPAPDGSASLDLLGRTIIRNASLALEVESVSESFDAVSAVAAGHGGFVSDSSLVRSGDDEAARFARLTLRVPAERFEQVLDDLRALAVEVTSASTSAQDVSGEVTDLESDLRNLRAVEAQYLELLGRANTIGEVLQVQDRLNQTRNGIERAEGRIALLRSLADLATLHVELRTPDAPPIVAEPGSSTPLDAAADAWEASLATLNVLAAVVLSAVVFSWWLLPLLALAWLALRRWGRHVALPRATIDTPGSNS